MVKILNFELGSSNLLHSLIYPKDSALYSLTKRKVFIQSLTPYMADYKCELIMDMHNL
jgi:hypothetical protein